MELAAVHHFPLSWLRGVHHSYENHAGGANQGFFFLSFQKLHLKFDSVNGLFFLYSNSSFLYKLPGHRHTRRGDVEALKRWYSKIFVVRDDAVRTIVASLFVYLNWMCIQFILNMDIWLLTGSVDSSFVSGPYLDTQIRI